MPKLPKLSRLEKALLANIGLEVITPGVTRAALLSAARGFGTVSPPVARGALGVGRAALGGAAAFGRAHPTAAAVGTVYVLNELGYLEPVKRELSQFPQTFREDLPRFEGPEVQKAFAPLVKAKKKVSKFNKAISAGMKTVRASKSYGKRGTISSAKKAFSAVAKTVAGLGKRKTPSKGIRRAIATTSAAKIYKDEILRRKMK